MDHRPQSKRSTHQRHGIGVSIDGGISLFTEQHWWLSGILHSFLAFLLFQINILLIMVVFPLCFPFFVGVYRSIGSRRNQALYPGGRLANSTYSNDIDVFVLNFVSMPVKK